MSETAVPSFTIAAVDGARIAATAAGMFVEMDEQFDAQQKAAALECIEEARGWLNQARALLSTPPSPIVVPGRNAGGLILP
ncbi:MAG TPA: hypothetical protein VGO11_19865 [Chthoniobacteraceae bacterium]|jgi:hypothetical protein|nr:hypothetical protein [Chthoniobacteraceae bacterium]